MELVGTGQQRDLPTRGSSFVGGRCGFPGSIYFEPGESGTPDNPIVVGSYDGGRATVAAGGANGFLAYNASGISVADLKFQGSGRTNDAEEGVLFYNDLPGDVTLPYVRIRDVEASGFRTGVVIGAFNGRSGFRDVRLTRLDVHDNVRAGLNVYGPPFNAAAPTYVHEDATSHR